MSSMSNVLQKCMTPKRRTQPGILSFHDFKALLFRERTRSDRNGSDFSVLAFNMAHPFFREHNGAGQLLIEEISLRKRCTDEVGFFRPKQVGIFLSDTDAYGADFVAHDLCSRLALPRTSYTIYTYAANQENIKIVPGGSVNGSSPDVPAYDPGPVALGLDWYFMYSMPLWKRFFDITGSAIMLILFSPVMLLTALAIKITSRGPVIFRQQRVGRGGKPFTFYKFRSMVSGAEEYKQALLDKNEQDGPIFKMRNDPRITPVGRILRKTSIDELPQLYNVLKGDMSLVGPRPPTVDEVPKYQSWQRRRLDLTGGLTCLWQVSGRSNVGFEDWMRMDLDYVRHKSLMLDLKLLLKTPLEVLRGRGAH
ncbi:MAG: sugar transferase [Planctomycetes bacterium]|nr:sugar transferase [Planctomycetota bacterium]